MNDLSTKQQFAISAKIAVALGWRAVRDRGQGFASGFAPGTDMCVQPVPNYFEPDQHGGKAEILDFVRRADGELKVLFLRAFDQRVTRGALYRASLHSADGFNFLILLDALAAKPGEVAAAFVAAASLNEEEAAMATA